MTRFANRQVPRHRVALVLLVGLLFGAIAAPGGPTGPSVARAADASSDIPGVPLPGPVSAGRLGGGIYDVVYRFTVTPGHVIVASLTGTAGTDFDIYLFDGSASTVLSEVGLLRKSTGPTSSESISWPSPVGGTYYIDLNGATDVEGDYRLTLQTVPDSTPPKVSMSLAGGRASINVPTVPVTLTAVDDLSGISDMAFSGDGLTFGPWQPFVRTTTWTFPPGDASRTLWAKVRNGVGLESGPTSATVAIDTDPPAVVSVSPAPGSIVVGLRPRFTVVFDEAMDPAKWTNLGLVVQEASGALIPGEYAYDVASRTGTFVPAIALQPGMTYVVTIGDARDVAGNPIVPSGSWTFTPLAPTLLEARPSSVAIVQGRSVRIDVTLTGAPPSAAVDVSARLGTAADFVPISTMAAPDGRLSLVFSPEQNTTYRFRYPGAPGVAPGQVDLPILVRRSVALVGRSPTVVSGARVGASVKLTAAIGPARAGVSVSFRLYRFDVARRTWVYAGSRGRNTDATGRASYTWVPPASGSWYWRAAVASTIEFANNTSPVYRWSVSR